MTHYSGLDGGDASDTAHGAARDTVRLDGSSLTREQVLSVARGVSVVLDSTQLQAVQRTADFLSPRMLFVSVSLFPKLSRERCSSSASTH